MLVNDLGNIPREVIRRNETHLIVVGILKFITRDITLIYRNNDLGNSRE